MPHTVAGIAELVILGALLGFLGGLFGIGGGLLAIPLLGLAFGLDEQTAQGTAMVMVMPTIFVGLWQYARRSERFDWRIALTLAAFAVPLTFAGAHVATHVASAPLRRAFAAFLALISLQMFARAAGARAASRERRALLSWQWAAPFGAVGGIISGLFSVGGAVFAVPFLTAFFGVSQATAQGLGLALVAPGTLVALATYGIARDVDWWIGVPLAVGSVALVSRGVALAHHTPERALQMLFSGMLLASAVGLWLRG